MSAPFPTRGTDNAPLQPMVEQGLDDSAMISRWLQLRYGGKSMHTRESYARESRRWLTFLRSHDRTLAGAHAGDVADFHALLLSPPAHWLRPRGKSRSVGLLDTQLLYGPLTPRSVQHAHVVLQSLYGWLMAVGHARRNPFAVVASPTVTTDADLQRYLSLESWQVFRDALFLRADQAPLDPLAQRDRFLATFLYHTGLRVAELAAAGMADIRPDRTGWAIHVLGKGRKRRKVTLSGAAMAELSRYRHYCGLPALPDAGETGPLLQRLRHRYKARGARQDRLTPGSLKGAWKALTRRTLAAVPDPAVADILADVSIHWMRHTFGTHRLMAGASLHSTQDELGHADINTTRIYAETAETLRREDAEKHGRFSQQGDAG